MNQHRLLRVLTVICLLHLLVSCGHRIRYTVKAEAPFLIDSTYAYLVASTDYHIVDSALIRNHSFEICGRSDNDMLAMLYTGSDGPETQMSFDFIVENGTLTGAWKPDDDWLDFSGTELNDRRKEIKAKVREAYRNDALDAADSLYDAVVADNPICSEYGS